jgi:hypothetical protein
MIPTPANFQVIRSDDRQSAIFAWDAPAPIATLVSYTINQSQRNNGLGYTVGAVVPHNPASPRQYTVIDNLDPDQQYSFSMFATDEDSNWSALTPVVTDF